jgi:hypothetical protein
MAKRPDYTFLPKDGAPIAKRSCALVAIRCAVKGFV